MAAAGPSLKGTLAGPLLEIASSVLRSFTKISAESALLRRRSSAFYTLVSLSVRITAFPRYALATRRSNREIAEDTQLSLYALGSSRFFSSTFVFAAINNRSSIDEGSELQTRSPFIIQSDPCDRPPLHSGRAACLADAAKGGSSSPGSRSCPWWIRQQDPSCNRCARAKR